MSAIAGQQAVRIYTFAASIASPPSAGSTGIRNLDMKSYAIFYVEGITDQERLKAYQIAAHPSVRAFGGKIIAAYGQQEVVEGPAIRGVVLIQFPDYQSASGWYHSPEYQAAKDIRRGAVDCHTVIFEGRE
jgi:uncharacterized protein (DUF1330 family)